MEVSGRLRLISNCIVCRLSGLIIPASPGISALLGFDAVPSLGTGVVVVRSNSLGNFTVSGCGVISSYKHRLIPQNTHNRLER